MSRDYGVRDLYQRKKYRHREVKARRKAARQRRDLSRFASSRGLAPISEEETRSVTDERAEEAEPRVHTAAGGAS